MNIILLSGGSGKRLWPLSNEANSKQFLKLFKNEHGVYESMVQRVYAQSKRIGNNILISSNETQVAVLQEQLGENIDIAIEPSRRNTFAALVLAAAYLHYKKGFHENEVVTAVPIDVCADAEYFQTLTVLPEICRDKNVALMGIRPIYPSEKYGYILINNGYVTGFKEKPTVVEAENLIENGALWNAGVFAFKIGYILQKAGQYISFDNYESLTDQFNKLPSNSFDYEVLEHESSIGYAEYEGKWKDLGTWNTLTDEMTENITGKNVTLTESCENVHVINMLGLPLVVSGISNAVVVASYDGILVSEKNQSSFIKPYVDKIDLRVMYEQRKWGNYRVLDYVRDQKKTSLTKRIKINAGKSLSYQKHNLRDEVWVIISGIGIVTVDGVKSIVESGSVVKISVGQKHKILAATDIEFIEVQLVTDESMNARLDEDDIERYD